MAIQRRTKSRRNIFPNANKTNTGLGKENEIKTIFVQPQDPEVSIAIASYNAARLSSTGQTTFNFYIPADFNAPIDIGLLIIPDTTESVQFDWDISFDRIGDLAVSSTSSFNIQRSVIANRMTFIDFQRVDLLQSGLKQDTMVGVIFKSDTSNIDVLGLRFRYI